MAIRVNTNIDSIFAQKHSPNRSSPAFSMARLSLPPYPKAADAAGLAASEKMRAQIKSLKMVQRNTQDGISMVQTAEGALQETDHLVPMRELVVESASEVLQATERAYPQTEFTALQTRSSASPTRPSSTA